ncbi:surfactin synthase subunit 2 [Ruminiclostridium hungatei]|uniref:Surfactin synthase subunit 2 n=1 Tax=Ruminiclostridium hungatei TaxID=48256 RepID=A0A1V4SNU9_RUMHU|nr:non-ribosomal peptide synthetase [Ruminiclostridium hungatei]OPX45146.1 surfactin synthase subunit 2 [Ruminiclostridium hungatei]
MSTINEMRDKLSKQRLFWESKDFSAAFEGPFIKLYRKSSMSPERTSTIKDINISIPEEATAEILRICSNSDLSLYILLLSLFKCIIWKYTGETQMSVLSPKYGSGGGLVLLQGGLTLPNDLRGTILETKKTVTDAYSNQDFPIEKILDDMFEEQELNRFFENNILFSLENIHKAGPTGSFDLVIAFSRQNGRLTGKISFASEKFHENLLMKLSHQFVNIIKSASQNIRQDLSLLKLLTPDEYREILSISRGNEVPVEFAGLHQLFEAQAHKTPDATALIYDEESISYVDLNRKANLLARRLAREGVERGDKVVLLFSPGIHMAVALLGVLKCGAAFVPVDTGNPYERIGHIIRETNAKIVLMDNGAENKPRYDLKQVDISSGEFWENIQDMNHGNLELPVEKNDLAYIIFTSGSTGLPKGVMIEHGNIVNAISWRMEEYRLGTDDAVLQLFSYCFDGFITSFFTPIVSGAKIVLLKDEAAKNPAFIAESIKGHAITHFISVPALYHSILEHGTPEYFRSLKKVTLAGDITDIKTIRLSKIRNKDIILINEYGPTENAVVTSFNRHMTEEAISNIGKPIQNVNIYILDSQLELLPQGIFGELYISGAGVSRGYIGSSSQNNEKFMENPFCSTERLYKTGDLARWLPDGTIEFKGRKDNQIKIRGFRIETEEIKACLQLHENVKEAVVLPLGEAANTYLCACVSINNEMDMEDLKDFLKNMLPHYMIPNLIIPLEDIPKTDSGKADAKAVRKLIGMQLSADDREKPENAVEETLVEIWKELLEINEVGVNQSFFRLGGHSLKATSLLWKIQTTFNVDLPLNQVLETDTIRKLAEIIANTGSSNFDKIIQASVQESYPISSEQKRMLLLSSHKEIGGSYHVPVVIHIQGRLDARRMEKALRALILRYEILRTSVVLGSVEPIQKVNENFEFSLLHETVEGETISEEQVLRCLENVELESEVLFKARVLTLNEEKHYLIMNFHHITIDEHSLAILLNDLSMLYNGIFLAKPALQYKDYALWQKHRKESEEYAEKLNYWKKELSSIELPLLNLPYDFIRPEYRSYEGKRLRFHLEEALMSSIGLAAKHNGVTLYMYFLAAFYILLYKYTGQRNIIVGSPISVRERPELKQMVGLFVNTIPLAGTIDPEVSFLDFLSEVKAKVLNGIGNGEVQFEDIVQASEVKADPSRHPLFDVMFAMQSLDMPGMKFMDMDAEFQLVNNNSSKFDLMLELNESEGSYNIEFEYSPKLFKEETITRFTGCLVNILTEISYAPDMKIKDIQLLSNEEREEIIRVCRAEAGRCEYSDTIVSIFEKQVRNTPQNIALVLNNEALTYDELNRLSNKLCCGIRQYIKPGDIVAMLCDYSFTMIITVLAIMKAGGAYLPLDVNYPRERINYILRDSGVKLLITNTAFIPDGAYTGKVISTQEIDMGADVPGHNPEPVNSSDSLAYVIYTSGTTGAPKGVMIEHGNVVNLIFNSRTPFMFNAQDVWTMYHSICFDFSVWEIYGALLSGGKLILIPNELARDPKEFCNVLKNNKVTVLNQTPTAFYTLSNEMLDSCQGESIRLRYVIFGGEALNPHKLKEWNQRFPNVRLINMYGITETTVHVTYKEITREDMNDGSSNVGQPLPKVYTYILDNDMNLCPVGVAGEIYVGGAGVGRGYLNRPELTGERFIEDPFLPGEKLYRSGDLAKLLHGGDMAYCGRTDRQLKIRGYRIELQEVESVLIDYELIREAVVTTYKDKENNANIAAYFTSDKKVPVNSIRTHLEQFLPQYMIPAYIIQLEGFVFTKNGKLDMTALPDPQMLQEKDVPAAPPATGLEKQMTEIWSEVLNIQGEKISMHDNFFHLGGDSIKAIKLLYLINSRLKLNLQIGDLYKKSIVRELCDYIESSGEIVDESLGQRVEEELSALRSSILEACSHKGIDTLDFEDVYPMSDIELGMIYHYVKNNNERPYHDQFIFQVPCNPEENEFLDRALGKVVFRHPILRSIFNIEDHEIPVHIVLRGNHIQPGWIDLRQYDDVEQRELILRHMEADRAKPFDFRQPFWRIVFFRVSGSSVLILLVTHHAILDGWSVASLRTELINTFFRLAAGDSGDLSPLKNSYRKYIVEQKCVESKKEVRQFWRDELYDYKRLQLPLAPTEQRSGKSSVSVVLENSIQYGLTEASLKYQTDMRSICFAAYIYMLNMYSYENDFIVGLVNNNRPLCQDGEKILGCFLNTIPFRAVIDKNNTWEDIILNTSRKIRALKPYDQLSLTKIVNSIGESEEQNPLFDTTFNFVNFDALRDTHIKNGFGIKDIAYTNTMLDFTVDLTSGSILVDMAFSSLVDEKHILAMLGYYKKILELFITEASEPARKDKVMPQDELDKIMWDFKDSFREYPRNKPIHLFFEEQVSRTPNKIAVVCGNQCLTYSELNQKADSIACLIRRRGGEVNTAIAIMTGRACDMIIGLLAILKAGCAFLPIEPGTPEDRVNYVIKNSKAGLMLTQGKYVKNASYPIPCILLEDSSLYDEKSCLPVENINTGRDLAYIIYTSGTTGNPKGVMVEHRSLVNLCLWHIDEYAVTAEDRATKYANFGFDVSVWEVFPYLICGAELHILKKELLLELEQLNKYLEQHRITIAYLPTPVCEQFMELENDSLRYLLTAGDKLRKYKKRNYRLANNYGPTETTVISTAMVVDKPYDNIPIGKAVYNTQLIIVDRNTNLQPWGAEGELCIAGDGLARGYMYNEELTDKSFRTDIFKGIRMYRTGDLARILKDGNIEYLGRNDRQVKIRGYRIELSEIESRMLEFTGIKKAVVDKNSKDEIEAFYQAEKVINIIALKDFLLTCLPQYMIPSRFTKIESVPLTPNGKIDYRALSKMTIEVKPATAVTILPQNSKQEVLLEVWKQVLRTEVMGIADDFFDMGGDSIKAMQAVAKLNGLGFDLKVNDLFIYRTIDKLSSSIRNKVDSIEQKMIAGSSRLNPIQAWFFENEFQNPHHWNQAFMLYRQEGFDAGILRSVWEKLIEHHDALRSTFRKENGTFRQFISDSGNNGFTIETVEINPLEDHIAKITEKAENLQRGLNIFEGPLIKAMLFKTKPGDYLAVVIHHLVIDAVSWRILFESFAEMYGQKLGGTDVKPKDKTNSIFDYMDALNSFTSGGNLPGEAEYWKKELGKEFCVLPKVSDCPQKFARDFNKISLSISREKVELLVSQVCRLLDTNLFEILLTCLGAALKMWTGGSRFRITLEGHGREEALLNLELYRTVGWFTIMYPFNLDVGNLEDYEDNIAQVGRSLESASRHRMSYGVLKYMSDFAEDLYMYEKSRNDVIFNYIGHFDSDVDTDVFSISDISCGNSTDAENHVQESLNISCYILNREFHLDVVYNNYCYQEETIRAMLKNYEAYLYDLMDYTMKATGTEKTGFIFSGIKPFNAVFFKDCFYHALISAFGHKDIDPLILFANSVSVFEADLERKDINFSNRYLDALNDDELLESLNISYKKRCHSDTICEDIVKFISEGYLPIINVDCYWLEGKKDAFQKTHWMHTLLVYGFDAGRREFSIVDNVDVFSLDYHEMTISYDKIVKAFDSYSTYFNTNRKQTSIFAISFERYLPGKSTREDISQSAIANIKNTFDLRRKSIENTDLIYDEFCAILLDENSLKLNIKNLSFIFNDILSAKRMEKYKISQLFANLELCSILEELIGYYSNISNVLRKLDFKFSLKKGFHKNLTESLKCAFELEKQYNTKLDKFIYEVKHE